MPLFYLRNASGRGSDRRAKANTAETVAKAALKYKIFDALSMGTNKNIRATNEAPEICPINRDVAIIPLADPLRARGADEIIILLFGAWKNPNPNPHTPNRHIKSNGTADSVGASAKRYIPRTNTDNPRHPNTPAW